MFKWIKAKLWGHTCTNSMGHLWSYPPEGADIVVCACDLQYHNDFYPFHFKVKCNDCGERSCDAAVLLDKSARLVGKI